MSEENINRIERKVDLLYKILLGLYIDESNFDGSPYNYSYIKKYKQEIQELFKLSDDKKTIMGWDHIPVPELKSLLELKEKELIKLNKTLEDGNYLKKDEKSLKSNGAILSDEIQNILDVLKDLTYEGIEKDWKRLVEHDKFFNQFRKKLNLSPTTFISEQYIKQTLKKTNQLLGKEN